MFTCPRGGFSLEKSGPAETRRLAGAYLANALIPLYESATIRPEQSPRRPLSLSRIRATAAACTAPGQKGVGRQDSPTNVTDVQSKINQALVHAASCGVTMNLM